MSNKAISLWSSLEDSLVQKEVACFREDAVAAGAGAKELVRDQCRVWLSGAIHVAEQHLAENPQSKNQPHVTNLPLLLDRMPCSASRGQKKRRFQVKAM